MAKNESHAHYVWLTRAAFLLALAIVIARATMLEILREPFGAVPGAEAPPRGPGPATSLVLNLLAWVPALLVLARRALDPKYLLQWHWSFAFMFALGAWGVISSAWSADRFAAAVNSLTFFSALVLLWAATQLVRDWLRLRLVAAVCFGLLLVFITQGVIYRFVELPELRRSWEVQRDRVFAERGWEPDSFMARQFEQRVLAGQMIGFNASPNSFAAIIVLMAVVGMGVIAQRIGNRDEIPWPILTAAALLPAVWIIWYTGSRTALVTPVLAAAMLGMLRLLAPCLTRHAQLAYGIGLGLILLIGAAVIGHGLRHGELFHDSLTFRWKYWIASFELFRHHWPTGVGWDNFGLYYLAFRLPEAPEEIRDPHNFIVRIFTELGVIGGVLLIGWMLRLWWEMTRPAAPAGTMPERSRPAISTIVIIAAAGLLLNIVASVDFEQGYDFAILELFRRMLFMLALVIGMTIIAVRSGARQEVDPRPALWVLHATVIGLGLFLLHNLIDFSLFETGPMFAFAVLAGAVLGMRPLPSPQIGRGRIIARAALVAGGLLWLAGAVLLAIPVWRAEHLAYEADDQIRAGRVTAAAAQLERAAQILPVNADYPYRAARALIMADAAPERTRAMLDAAIAINPMGIDYYLTRAGLELAGPAPDGQRVREDYDRAVALNPNDVQIRLGYARAMQQLNRTQEAVEQYELALHYNDLLDPVEPKRLSDAHVEQIRRTVAELTAGNNLQ